MRTETSQTFANPDGSLTTESTAGVARVRDSSAPDGWRDVDLTLRTQADGSIAPVSAVNELSLNPGGAGSGAHPLVSLTDGSGSDSFALSWPDGDLPVAEIDGSTVRYKNVRPGQDLLIEATREGFEQTLVLTSKPASANDAKLVLPVVSHGLFFTSNKDAGDAAASVAVTTKSGKTVGAVGAPEVTDARVDAQTGAPEHSELAAQSVQTVNGAPALVVQPSQDFLDSAAYPVTVDPTVSLNPSGDTYVDSGYPDQNYVSSTSLHMGTYDSGAHKARAYVKFDGPSGVAGSQILAATVKLWEEHAYNCTASSFTISPANSAIDYHDITWNNQPGVSSSNVVTVSSALGGGSSCPAGWVSANVAGIAAHFADEGQSVIGMALKASETSNAAYKRFNSAGASSGMPVLSVTYNRLSSVPSAVTIRGQVSASSGVYVATGRPAFSATATDPEGGTVDVAFQVYDANSTDSSHLLGTCISGKVASGATATCTYGGSLSDNTHYWYRAGSADVHMTSHRWGGLKAFTTAIGKPAAPTITCPAPYTSGSWQQTAPSANVTCTAKTAASTSSTAPVKITTTVDGGTAASTAVAAGAAGTRSVTVSKASGSHKITAYATSVTGVVSSTVSYAFGYGSASITSPASGFKTADTVQVEATGPPLGTATAATAQLQWTAAGVDGWKDAGSASTVTPASGQPAAASFTWDTGDAPGDSDGVVSARQVATLQLRVHFTYTGAAVPNQYTAPITVVHLPHAFDDGFPTADAGSGQVGLWTGELNTSATDVTVGTAADSLQISRQFYSYAGPGTATGGVFGPGWQAALDGPDAGYGGAQVIDENANLAAGSAATGAIILSTGAGDLVFAPHTGKTGPSPADTYVPVDDDTVSSGVTLTVTGSSPKTLTATDRDGTVTTWTLQTSGTAHRWVPAGVAEPGAQGQTTYSVNGDGKVTRILAAQPYGDDNDLSCPATGELNPGCAALTISYLGAGDAARVSRVDYTAYDPATAAMRTTTVASYSYDSSNRLASVTDRYGVTTRYTYTSSGDFTLLTGEHTDGQAAWTYEYDAAGRLVDVKRGPASGSGADVVDAAFVYGLDPAAAGMPPVSADEVAAWGQQTAPTHAWAVFGLDHPVTGSPTAEDLKYAQLLFTDDDGYTVNTAEYGAGRWLVSWQGYDSDGTPTDSLGPTQTQAALDAQAAGDSYDAEAPQPVTHYLDQVDNPDDPDNPYVPADTTPVDEWSPVYEVTDPDGTVEGKRLHTHYTYDTGAPGNRINPATGTYYLLPTEVKITVADEDAPDADTVPSDEPVVSDTVYGYDPIDGASSTGDTSGWTLGTPTVTTQVLSSFGEPDITTKTLYDAHGQTIATWQPGSTGHDSLTTSTILYTAGSNSADPACGNKPEWAGLECWSGPAAAPSSGVDLTDTRITGYDYWLNPTTTVESSGTGTGQATRTTTDTYYSDGRLNTEQITTTGLTGSTPVPETQVLYDSTTKQQTGTASLTSTGTPSSTDQSVYDQWGRVTSYTNSLGETTTTSYVPAGQPGAGQVAVVTSPVSTSTYSYDGTDADGNTEHRGLATGLTVTGVGSYTAAYDPDGNLVTQDLPAGITEQLGYDDTGRLTSLEYDGQVTDPDTGESATGAWLAFSRDYNQSGQVLDDFSPAGTSNTPTGYTRQYSYDGAGRLIQVDDATDPASGDTSCTVRQYAFDQHGNRTSLTSTQAPDQCTTDTTVTGATQTAKTWSYDADSRQLSGANGSGTYTYDAFGRQTLLPAADAPDPDAGDITLGYYDTDAAHTITQDGITTTYALDPDGRRLTATTSGNQTGTVTNHYADDSDNPTWATSTTATGASTTVYTPSLGGGLSASSETGTGQSAHAALQLADPAGNIVATVTIPATADATGIDSYTSYDEYGNPDTTTPGTGADQYGWLGTEQRASGGAGLILMGARLYNPTTGRFTSTDPVSGGNENAYNYPNDPVDQSDATGQMAAILVGLGTSLSELGIAAEVVGVLLAALAIALAIAAAAAIVAAVIWLAVKMYKRVAAAVRAVKWATKTNYRKDKWYNVYALFNPKEGGLAWKYGITSTGASRPRSQLKACEKSPPTRGSVCRWTWVAQGILGYYNARVVESLYFFQFYLLYGRCPTGARYCK
ncbi:DNRLRE domain-containing protein [Gryllotalpicola ginsengisoli]|uniref:DNRLRE domain-containing protein n=1 Tax=Gryllotalpicola ginsengisoli TaxID=444608 RepID=UPI0003B35FA8|nr:DNRLRE domain-containing protein [Gryllotalpicola ginsengisoli]